MGVLLPGAPNFASFNENLSAFLYNQKSKYPRLVQHMWIEIKNLGRLVSYHLQLEALL